MYLCRLKFCISMTYYKLNIPFLKRKDIPWIILLSIIVLIPNLFLAFYGSDLSGSFLKTCTYIFISCLLFLLPSLLLKAKAFFLVQGIFVVLAPLEIAHIYMNKMTMTSGYLMSIIDTNWDEFSEVFSSVNIPIFCYLGLCVFYFFIAIKKIDNTYLIHSKKTRVYALCGFIFVLIAGYAFYLKKSYQIVPNKKEVFSKTNEIFCLKFYKIYPYDLILQTKRIYSLKKELQKGKKELQHFQFNAKKENQLTQKEVYVFIIGETGRYSNYSINGYNRETSPLLKETQNLVTYSDFYSESNITEFSLPTILTRASPQNFHLRFKEKSFVDAFKEAGFKTYWIANQSANNSFIRRISKDADGEYFTTTDFDATENFDEKLWVFMNEVLQNQDEKVLIVLHTLGSHFRYNFRYPDKYKVFEPSFEGTFDYALISPKNKEQFINTYDNSILYTDFFIANTIQKIDNLNSIGMVMYVSDHGENLYDTDENIALHGGSFYTKYDFHVPFFVWTSDEYNAQYPDKVENIKLNKDKRLSAGNIFYSILDIADITFPERKLNKSIASESLLEDSIRYIINTNMEMKKGY